MSEKVLRLTTSYNLPLTSYILHLTTYLPTQSPPLLKLNNITIDILCIDKRERTNILDFGFHQFANPASAVLQHTIQNFRYVIDPKCNVSEAPSVSYEAGPFSFLSY